MPDESAPDQHKYIWFRIQDDQLIVGASMDGSQDQFLRKSISGIRSLLEQGGLTEASVENAIAQIEDLVIPIIRSLPSSKELKVSGLELARIMSLLPEPESDTVPIESVEDLFNQFADHVGGSPVAWNHTLSPAHAALGLIALREVTHHGAFRHVSLLQQQQV